MLTSLLSYLPEIQIFKNFSANLEAKTPLSLFSFLPSIPFFNPSSSNSKRSAFQAHHIDLLQLASKSQKNLNDEWESHLDQVLKDIHNVQESSDLTSEDKENSTAIIKKLSPDNLALFFQHLATFSIDHNEDKLIDEILNAIPLDSLQDIVKDKLPQGFSTLDAWIQQVAASLPSETSTPVRSSEDQMRASRSRNVVTQFFPNMGNVFLRAFNLFDAPRPPDTLYEYGVLVTLYINFFKLPYFLVKSVDNFTTSPLHTLVISTLIIGMAVGLLYTYLRWLKPCPETLSYCKRLSNDLQHGEPVLCRDTETQKIIGCLGTKSENARMSFAVIGEPGIGKTTWKEGLAAKLPHMKFFDFENAKLFGMGSSVISAAEKMEQSFQEVRFHENEVVFCFDELGDAIKFKPGDITTIFKSILGRNRQVQLIAFITTDQWEELLKMDKAIGERFRPIHFAPMNDSQTEQVLYERMRRQGSEMSFSYQAIIKIIDETNKDEEHCQPRKAVNLLDELMNRIDYFDINNYKVPEQYMAEETLKNLEAQSKCSDSPLRDPSSKACKVHLENIQKAKEEIEKRKKETEEVKTNAIQLKKALAQDRHLQQMMNSSARQINSEKPKETETDLLKKRFAFANFFGLKKLSEVIGELKSGLKGYHDVFLCIDESTVDAILASRASSNVTKKTPSNEKGKEKEEEKT